MRLSPYELRNSTQLVLYGSSALASHLGYDADTFHMLFVALMTGKPLPASSLESSTVEQRVAESIHLRAAAHRRLTHRSQASQ
jgi:hypothetical protein